jgi:hypothetical protein
MGIGSAKEVSIEKSMQLSGANENPLNSTVSPERFDINTEAVCLDPTSTFPKSYSSVLPAAHEKSGERMAIEKIPNKISKCFVFIILSPHFW